MKKKFIVSALLSAILAIGCGVFAACGVEDSKKDKDKTPHTQHTYTSYKDNYNGTCTGTCSCGVTYTGNHVYDDENDGTCNLCGHMREVGGNTDKPGETEKPGNTDKPEDTGKPGNTDKPGETENPGDSQDDPVNPPHTEHTYTNYKDNGNGTCTGTCSCGDTKTGNHVYDNDKDPTCNNCGSVRKVDNTDPVNPPHTTHDYKNYTDNGNGTCTGTCSCGEPHTDSHVYDNDSDPTCNRCGSVRQITPPHTTHTYTNYTDNGNGTCTGTCSCGEPHTDSHVYDDESDTTCNRCGHVRTVTIHVTGVTLNKSSDEVTAGANVQLTATVSPANATDSSVSWSSSNTAVATVDSTGKVKGMAQGSAVITVTTTDGSRTAQCTITVKAQSGSQDAQITYSYMGNECAAFEWADSTTAGVQVQYKLSSASSYTSVDSQLIRPAAATGKMRVDIVGLKGGSLYDFKITTSTGSTLYSTNNTINSHDRSGYAHFGATDGVGAYNNDGTLKSNAKVIYLTESNKNNISVDGVAQNKSIAQYLATFKNNTNSTPIVIRVIGVVGSATWNEKTYPGFSKTNPLRAANFVANTPGNGTVTLVSSESKDYTQTELINGGFNTLNTTPERYNGATCLAINGLNSKIMCRQDSKGNWNYDSCWNDCSVSNVNNITVEGIGEDAEIFQWGFTFKSSKNIEVRNLHFDDYTEDACSFEGGGTSATSLNGFTHERIWLHHNTFDEGRNYWDVCDEQDKNDGDGSTDFKGVKNVTIAYNTYIQTHKTGLIGGSDSAATASVTFHHNYYNGCNQRMPLGRQANMHMYNNYYSSSTLYSISLRAGAYAFIENSVFTEDANNHWPVELVKGDYGTAAAKIVNCSITTSKIVQKDKNENTVDLSAYLYVGNNRDATVNTTDQRFAPDFDTNTSTFYYDVANAKTNVTHMMNTSQVTELVPQLAGVQKRGVNVASGNTGNNAVAGSTGGSGNTPVEHVNTYSYSAITGITTDKTKLVQTDLTGVNAFLTLKKNCVTYRRDTANGVTCIENKDDGLSVTFSGTGTIAITFSSTGSTNESRIGLKNSDGSYIATTLFDSGVSAVSSGADVGAYSVTGTAAKTITFNVTASGTYTIVCPSGETTRGARITAIVMRDTY